MKKQYSSKERKIWKLKRKNVVLGQQRSSLLKNHDDIWSYNSINKLIKLSEKIGKNSANIQRLRTIIQQEKK